MIIFLDAIKAAPEGITGAIIKGFRTLCFNLCTFIYQAIIFVYNIFDKLCKGRFLSNEILQSFAERIGVILGLVMAFVVIFSLIKMVLDPDKLNDKEMGAASLIKKLIITIVLLGVSNYIFNLLYLVQKTVIESDAISKLLLPVQIDEETSDDFGKILSLELLSSFYYVDTNPEQFVDKTLPAEYNKCDGLVSEFKNQVIEYGKFDLGYQCLNDIVDVETDTSVIETFVVTYNPLFSVITGVIVLYLLFVYCVKVGIRMIQLMFLEIIAPMAIVSYVSPKKDTMFSKWTKIYISTYIDVFIRIAIINFVVFIIATIFASAENGFAFWGSITGGADIVTSEKKFITVIIIIALLTFAKKAPELLKELLPASASKLGFGMSSPKQLFDSMLGGSTIRKGLTTGAKIATYGAAIGAAGAITSGISRYRMNMKGVDKNDPEALKNARRKAAFAATGGAFMAMGRGLKTGATAKGNIFSNIAKGVNTQRGIDDKYDELITTGGSPLGTFTTKIESYIGETKGQYYSRIIKNNEAVSSAYKSIDDVAEGFKQVKIARTAWENAKARGASDTELDFLYDQYKGVKDECISDALETGIATFSGKDQSVAAQIGVFKNDLSNLVKNNQVEVYTTNDRGERVKIGADDFVSAKVLEDASVSASMKISEIKNKDDYNSAIANDKNAGVNSNATTKK